MHNWWMAIVTFVIAVFMESIPRQGASGLGAFMPMFGWTWGTGTLERFGLARVSQLPGAKAT